MIALRPWREGAIPDDWSECLAGGRGARRLGSPWLRDLDAAAGGFFGG
jgi:hypothetical protein